MDGVLIVDKPRGPTSHDVVAWTRRALRTRAIGHAGTLDPMATGVLVLGVGEGTKLTSYLMAEDKEYEATVALGAETDSLDAEGAITERVPVPLLDRAGVERALVAFVGTYLQRAPAVSAIKKDGVPLHVRARRGEDVVAPEREVTCHGLELLAIGPEAIELRVRCGKGFYVRSLGRDLARALGTRGHLSALRRTRSGRFAASEAVSGELLAQARSDDAARERVIRSMLSMDRALGTMPRVHVDEAGARAVRYGQRLRIEAPEGAPSPLAVIAPEGVPIAIAEWREGALRVLRGLRLRANDGA